jgi:tetratricopeptide (TPR) repeat protein
MKFVVMLTILSALFANDPLKTTKINRAKSQAKTAFNSGDYKTAIQKYRFLIDSMGVKEDPVYLNLAHAYYLAKDTANAFSLYQQLSASSEKGVNSKANQQLGVMTNMRGKAEEALNYFKQAIKSDPLNEDARYNYEMLKKKLDEKKQQDEQKKKDEKNKQDQKNQEPSEFAKKLKEQADRLVAQKQYRAAFDLMTDGLKKDKTVSTYQDYINRLKDVAEINK